MSLSNILHSPITYVIIFFLILIFIQVIFYFIFGFENIITIKDKYVVSGYKGEIKYYIVDNNNNLYIVDNVWFLGDFNKAEDYNLLNKDDTYKVKGYGFRIDMLSIYPTIYNITKN
jgi:hypothetical protein